MTLVEVIRALQTSDAAFATTMELRRIGKTPVAVNDAPGCVESRADALINEAAYR